MNYPFKVMLGISFCAIKSQRVREETIKFNHKINYFNPYIVVSFDNCACCSQGPLALSDRPQLAAPMRRSVL